MQNRDRGERRARRAARRVLAASIAVLIASAAPCLALADQLDAVTRELTNAPDFRVRVNAALALGKTHDGRALSALTRALDDRHPAVRAAAAAAIGAAGQLEGLSALRRRAARERAPSVQTQLASAIAVLAQREPGAPVRESRVLVKLGQLESGSGVRAARLSSLFRGATRRGASALPGVEVLSDAADARDQEQARKLPVLLLDGVVVRLARGSEGERVMVSAQVEYVFRKVPEHALRASFTGAAKALGGSRAIVDRGRVAHLEDQAVEGAVESAMRGAPEVMLRALRSDD